MARKKGPQTQQAYTYIKQKIQNFQLPPGMAVSDYTLEQELKMSRSPIREAIMRLSQTLLLLRRRPAVLHQDLHRRHLYRPAHLADLYDIPQGDIRDMGPWPAGSTACCRSGCPRRRRSTPLFIRR